MTKHTPGPWVLRKNEDDESYDVTHPSYDPTHEAIAYVGYDNNEANAKLIAAAPEMLEYLIAYVNDFGFKDTDGNLHQPAKQPFQIRKAFELLQKHKLV